MEQGLCIILVISGSCYELVARDTKLHPLRKGGICLRTQCVCNKISCSCVVVTVCLFRTVVTLRAEIDIDVII